MTKTNGRIVILLLAAAALFWVWSESANGSIFGVPLAIICKRHLFSAPACAPLRSQMEVRSFAVVIVAAAALIFNERRKAS